MANPNFCSDDDFSSSLGSSLDLQGDMADLSDSPTAMSSTSGLDDAENLYFAKKESLGVKRLRFVVFLILFLVGAGVCASVFLIIGQGQQEEFEAAFEGDATKLMQSTQNIFGEKIGALTHFSVTMSSYAQETGKEWPFVTVTDYRERTESLMQLSGALLVALLPLVYQENLEQWNSYSMRNMGWIPEFREYQARIGVPPELNPMNETRALPFLATFDRERGIGPAMFCNPCAPAWQQSPLPHWLDTNFNLLDVGGGIFASALSAANAGDVYLGGLVNDAPGYYNSSNPGTRSGSSYLSFEAKEIVPYSGEPISTVFIPVMNSLGENKTTAAIIFASLRWAQYFKDILTDSLTPVQVVLENDCDGAFTYTVKGPDVVYEGPGNLADSRYDDMRKSLEIDSSKVVFERDVLDLTLKTACGVVMHVYPTLTSDSFYNDNFALVITLIVAAVFVFTVGVFVTYDCMVERRQRKVMDTAKISTAIVSSIFPRRVRDQLMSAPVQGNATKLRSLVHAPQVSNKMIADGLGDIGSSRPIADLFASCTVMFADVEGFTAWSSIREPSQVFALLEAIYGVFDAIAQRRKVFKVETVGDCYVAVCGLPDPDERHAIVMARFAQECIEKHDTKVKELALVLGPGTEFLRLRVGLNSGPITAGVLRGERSRFQLFGDTVNTCSRIEASGEGGRIHISESCANLLREAGHARWISEREDMVSVKGKGQLNTFWLDLSRDKNQETPDRLVAFASDLTDVKESSGSKAHLVEWNTKVLMKVIKDIMEARGSKKDEATVASSTKRGPTWIDRGTTPLEEVQEVIALPGRKTLHGKDVISSSASNSSITVPSIIEKLVREYIGCLADMYRNGNPFHNFEHASHVTMAVAKLLSRIVAPSDMNFSNRDDASKKLHDHTYGITSDPLTHFACVLAALIHDVDHQGVTNTTLVIEEDPLVDKYHGKSIAEQNSVDLAWNLLMKKRFQPLVSLLCPVEADLIRLRQLVVNAVMATDIMDPDLKKLRNNRWDKAFATSTASAKNASTITTNVNRKATIVIEHLIQASDVSHTMQHWRVYIKWNGLLFKEMYKAYMEGRGGAKDPSLFWAKGEIGFFDFYIIPLAKKLKDCGVFGVSSDEFLEYARANRDEWKLKGEAIVAKLVEEVHQEYGERSDDEN